MATAIIILIVAAGLLAYFLGADSRVDEVDRSRRHLVSRLPASLAREIGARDSITIRVPTRATRTRSSGSPVSRELSCPQVS